MGFISEISGMMMSTLNTFLLIIAALVPALALCIYVFVKDRVEKEPVGLLFLLLFFGALSCIPAAIIENILIAIIDFVFGVIGYIFNGTFLEGVLSVVYRAVYYIFGVALVEEGLKFLILVLLTRRSKDFNSLFDGMIYAIFVSLGFAAFENIFYVLENGWGNAVARAVLSVPGHMFFAVMMGYYYSLVHLTDAANSIELELKNSGLVVASAKPFGQAKNILFSMIMPIAAHGFYNFTCSSDSIFTFFVFIVFVLFMYFFCFGKIRKMSAADAPSRAYAKWMVINKYPCLEEFIKSHY